MTTQIEAERLADEISNKLSWVTNFKAAAELRRLVSFNKDLMDEVARLQAELRRLVSFNQQLMDEVARLQKREWVGLTAKERSELWWETDMSKMPEHDYGKAIEAKLKEKNT